MYIELLEWFLDILEHDYHDLAEETGKIKMALALMKRSSYSFERASIAAALIGKEEDNAES